MLIHARQVLPKDEVKQFRQVLDDAPWADGRVSSGVQAAHVKHNEQLPESHPLTRQLREQVLQALQHHAMFFSAALPRQVSPPMFNRYGGELNTFGNHVDSAVRYLPAGAGRVRTDISCTIFLSEPDEYEGGELVIEDTFGPRRVKLAAGDMVVYPGTSVHRVEPVTRGHRMACFFWVQSMVRSDEQRRLLYDMDMHLMRLRSTVGETDEAVIGLTAAYHNLLRMWIDV